MDIDVLAGSDHILPVDAVGIFQTIRETLNDSVTKKLVLLRDKPKDMPQRLDRVCADIESIDPNGSGLWFVNTNKNSQKLPPSTPGNTNTSGGSLGQAEKG